MKKDGSRLDAVSIWVWGCRDVVRHSSRDLVQPPISKCDIHSTQILAAANRNTDRISQTRHVRIVGSRARLKRSSGTTGTGGWSRTEVIVARRNPEQTIFS